MAEPKGVPDDDEFDTPIDLNLRRPASPASRAIANLALSVGALAVDLGTSARNLDELEGAERAGFLVGLARKLGEAAEGFHEARRLIQEMGEGK